MTGEAAERFDRDILMDYNRDLGDMLQIEDLGSTIIVSVKEDMPEKDKDNSHLILEGFGFE